jgi:hypothetical protein
MRLRNVFTAACAAAAVTCCGVAPLATRATRFGAAASAVAKDSSAAYDTVEKAVFDAQVSAVVLDFDSKGFDPGKIKPFLSGEDLEARHVLLRALKRYADSLQDVAGKRAAGELDAEVSGLGQQLKDLSGNAALQKIGGTAADAEIKGLTAAVDALGNFALERRRREGLRPILTRMQEVIDRICALLDADLGSRPNAEGVGGRGLRGQLWIEYDQLIGNQRAFILRNEASLTPPAKAAELAKLPELAKHQRTGDEALAATQTALSHLAKTHRALLMDAEKRASFAASVAELRDDSERIADFYKDLSFK